MKTIWLKRITKSLLTILLLLAFLAGAFTLTSVALVPVYSLLSIHALNDYVMEMESLGESLSIEPLIPPPVTPDEENFANAEIIRTLVSEAEKNSVNELESISLLGSLRVDAIPGYESPQFSRTRPVRHIETYSLHHYFPGTDNEAEAARSVIDYCDGIDDILDEIAIAATRPHNNFNLNYHEGYAMTYPEGSAFRDIGTLLHFRTKAHLEKRDPAAAIESLETMLRISGHLKRENTLVHQLIAITIEGQVMDNIQKGMRKEIWNTEHYRTLEDFLRPRKMAPGLLSALRMERAIFVDLMQSLGEQGHQSPKNLPGFFPGYQFSKWKVSKGWLADNAMKFSELIQEEMLSDENGNRRIDSLPINLNNENSLLEIRSSLPRKFRYIYVNTALPAYHGVCQRFLREQTRLDLLRIAIEIEKFRLLHSDLPESLDAARFHLGGGGLLGPFSGSPYRYEKLESEHFQLYSVGPNRIDEGGELKKRPEFGDWVWRLTLPDDFNYEEYSSH